MSDAFTQSFDASDWAAAFVAHVKENPSIPLDEGCMIGWFANAIMRGYDEFPRRDSQHKEGAELLAARDRGRVLFGHLVDGKCQCVYCTRDLEGLVEHAADYELRCFSLARQVEELLAERDKIGTMVGMSEADLAFDALAGRLALQGRSATASIPRDVDSVWIWDGRKGAYYSLTGDFVSDSFNSPETFNNGSYGDWKIVPVPSWFTAHAND